MATDLYSQAGVSIDAGSQTISLIKDDVASTHSSSVITGLGSFGALYDLKQIVNDYKEPILVQSIDGVGTKLSVAKLMNKFDTVGEDIVNHSINDILVMGARGLTFLDYVAHDKLDPALMADIVKGMCKACRENGLSLVGGETAEMPGTYQTNEHDIAGCITGIVEKSKVITGEKVKAGDVLIGIESSGLHTNGYSLARTVLLKDHKVTDQPVELDGQSIGEVLLKPHLSYGKEILDILDSGIDVHSLAHITGGGFTENIPRVLPDGVAVEINDGTWPVFPIFNLIQELGSVSREEMFRVFNMGIGMIIIVDPSDAAKVKNKLSVSGKEFYTIGKVVVGNKEVTIK
ncbi:MAG: phosphoribosylformylglycinamidine cyclo-ligase [Candidatus Melainabacteria bacterium]|nr:phosphoribosylformylglycinamidine cyclo-ligase [Candidatus Melainabacteria bacterium]